MTSKVQDVITYRWSLGMNNQINLTLFDGCVYPCLDYNQSGPGHHLLGKDLYQAKKNSHEFTGMDLNLH